MSATENSANGQFVTLGVGEDVFAIDVGHVHEILELGPVSRLPSAPKHIMGMIDVRRRAVPLVDLRVKMGLDPIEATHNTRILVIDVEVGSRRIVLGLVADRVYEVTDLSERSVAPPPDIGIAWQSDYIKGVGRRGEKFVIILNLSRLFSDAEVAAIRGNVPESQQA